AWHTHTHTTKPGTRLTRALLTTWTNNPTTNHILTTTNPNPENISKFQQLKNAAPILKYSTDQTIQAILDAYRDNTLTQLAKNRKFQPRADLDGTGKNKRLQNSDDKTAFLEQVAAAWNTQRDTNPQLNTLLPTSTELPETTSGLQQLKNAAPILKRVTDQTIQAILDAYRDNTLTQLAKNTKFQPRADLDGTGKNKRLQNSDDKTAFFEKVAAAWNTQRDTDPQINTLLSTSTELPETTSGLQQLKNAAPILKRVTDQTIQIILDAYRDDTLTQLAKNRKFQPRADLHGNGKKLLQKSADKTAFLEQVAAAWNTQRDTNPQLNAPLPKPAISPENISKFQQLKNASPILKHSTDQTIQTILDAYRDNTLTQLAKNTKFKPFADLDDNGKKRLNNSADKTALFDKVKASWNTQRSRDAAFNALFSQGTGENPTHNQAGGPSIYTVFTQTGGTLQTPPAPDPAPLEQARQDAARAHADLLRHETALHEQRVRNNWPETHPQVQAGLLETARLQRIANQADAALHTASQTHTTNTEPDSAVQATQDSPTLHVNMARTDQDDTEGSLPPEQEEAFTTRFTEARTTADSFNQRITRADSARATAETTVGQREIAAKSAQDATAETTDRLTAAEEAVTAARHHRDATAKRRDEAVEKENEARDDQETFADRARRAEESARLRVTERQDTLATARARVSTRESELAAAEDRLAAAEDRLIARRTERTEAVQRANERANRTTDSSNRRNRSGRSERGSREPGLADAYDRLWDASTRLTEARGEARVATDRLAEATREAGTAQTRLQREERRVADISAREQRGRDRVQEELDRARNTAERAARDHARAQAHLVARELDQQDAAREDQQAYSRAYQETVLHQQAVVKAAELRAQAAELLRDRTAAREEALRIRAEHEAAKATALENARDVAGIRAEAARRQAEAAERAPVPEGEEAARAQRVEDLRNAAETARQKAVDLRERAEEARGEAASAQELVTQLHRELLDRREAAARATAEHLTARQEYDGRSEERNRAQNGLAARKAAIIAEHQQTQRDEGAADQLLESLGVDPSDADAAAVDSGAYPRRLDHILGSELLEHQRVLLRPGGDGTRGFDHVLDHVAVGLPDGARETFRTEFRKNPYPFFGKRGKAIRIGDQTATLRLSSDENHWVRTGSLPASGRSTPDLFNSDTVGRKTAHSETVGEKTSRSLGGSVYINPLLVEGDGGVRIGPAIVPMAQISTNQPSTSETVKQDTAVKSEAVIGGRAVGYSTDLRITLTVHDDQPDNAQAGDDQAAALDDVTTAVVADGLAMTVELGDRASAAPDRIVLRDPFDPETRPEAGTEFATGNPGMRLGGGHPASVGDIRHGRRGTRGARLADWVVDHLNQPRPRTRFERFKDAVIPGFMRGPRTDPRHSEATRELLSEESVRDHLSTMTRGPVHLEVRDDTGHPRVVKMWSVPTELNRLPDAPAKLDLPNTVTSTKEIDSTYLRSRSWALGLGSGLIVQVVNNIFRLDIPTFDYRYDNRLTTGDGRTSGGTTGKITQTGDTAMYDVNRTFYLQFDGEDTPHRFTGDAVEILGVDDARLLADPDADRGDALARPDHTPAYPHLGSDRPDHFGGTPIRGITWADGSQYDTPAADGDGQAPAPRTLFEAYAQQVLDGIARKYPGMVVPDLSRAQADYALRPDGSSREGAFFTREKRFQRDHAVALYNTAKVLEQISEANLMGRPTDWINDGIDIDLIDTALLNPDVSNLDRRDPGKEGWIPPETVTVRLTATPRDREFGGTVTKNHVSTTGADATGRRRIEERESAHSWTARVRAVFRDLEHQDPRTMARFQAGGGVQAQYKTVSTTGLETGVRDITEAAFADKGDTDVWRYGLDLHAEMGKFRKTDDLGPDARAEAAGKRTGYDGHRVDLLTDAAGNPVRLQGRMEIESPANDHPEPGTPPRAQSPDQEQGTSLDLTPAQVRNIIAGEHPPVADARQPEAAALDTIPTFTEGISTRAGDSTLRQRLHTILDSAPGLQRFLKSRAGHGFYPTHYSNEGLSANSAKLFSAPGHRSRNWMRDFMHSGRHTTALHAERTGVVFHDPRTDSTLKTTSGHSTTVSISQGTSRTRGIEGELRGVGNPNPSIQELKDAQSDNDPNKGKLRTTQANRPAPQLVWNFLSKAWTTGTSAPRNAAFTSKTSFTPQGGVRPYTADLLLTQSAEIRRDLDLAVNVPRAPRSGDYRGLQTTIENAEFGYAPLHSLYHQGLVNDRYHDDRVGPQDNPRLDARNYRVRPGFEGQGQHLGTSPRVPDALGGSAPGTPPSAGGRLADRLRRDNYVLTGRSREALLREISAHLTTRGTPTSVPVRLEAQTSRLSSRAELRNQTREGSVTVETVRGPARVVQLGGKALTEHENSLSASSGTTNSSTTTTGTRAEIMPMIPTPTPGGGRPKDLPDELDPNRFTSVGPAPGVNASSSKTTALTESETSSPSWTTELTGPYGIVETPAHIRLTVEYGRHRFTVEGDHSTVKEAFFSGYLVPDSDTAAVPDSPAPQRHDAPARLDGAIRAWREGVLGEAEPPPAAHIAPLTVQDGGRRVLDASYAALATANGWRHTGPLTPAAVASAKAFLVDKAKLDPANDPIASGVNEDSLKVLLVDAASGDGSSMVDAGRTKWTLGAFPDTRRATVIDVAVDSALRDSTSPSTSRSENTTQSSTGGASLPVRPAGWIGDPPSSTPEHGVALGGHVGPAAEASRSAGRTDERTDSAPTDSRASGSKRSYLVSVPTTWAVAAERPHREVAGMGRATGHGMATAESFVTSWISEDDARSLGLLDGERTDAEAWDRVATAQEELAEAEKAYYEERARLVPLVAELAAAPDSRRAREDYDLQEAVFTDARTDFEEKFAAWHDAHERARNGFPGTGPEQGPGTGPEQGPGTGPEQGPGTGPEQGPGTGPEQGPGTGTEQGPGTGRGPGTGTDQGPGTGRGRTGRPPLPSIPESSTNPAAFRSEADVPSPDAPASPTSPENADRASEAENSLWSALSALENENGFTPPRYVSLVRENIPGTISMDEVLGYLENYYQLHQKNRSFDSVFDSPAEEQSTLALTDHLRENGALRPVMESFISQIGHRKPLTEQAWDSLVNPARNSAPIPDRLLTAFGSEPGQVKRFTVGGDSTSFGASIRQLEANPGSPEKTRHPRLEWNRTTTTDNGRTVDAVEVVLRLRRRFPWSSEAESVAKAEQALVRSLEDTINKGRTVTDSHGTTHNLPYTLRDAAPNDQRQPLGPSPVLRLRVEITDPGTDGPPAHADLEWSRVPHRFGAQTHEEAAPEILAWFGLTESGESQLARELDQERKEQDRKARDNGRQGTEGDRTERAGSRRTPPPARVTPVSLARLSELTAGLSSPPAPVHSDLVTVGRWEDNRSTVPVTTIGVDRTSGTSGVDVSFRDPKRTTVVARPLDTELKKDDEVPVTIPGQPGEGSEGFYPARLETYANSTSIDVQLVPVSPARTATGEGGTQNPATAPPTHVAEVTMRLRFDTDKLAKAATALSTKADKKAPNPADVQQYVAEQSRQALAKTQQALDTVVNFRHRLSNADGTPGPQLHFRILDADTDTDTDTGTTNGGVTWLPSDAKGGVPRSNSGSWAVDATAGVLAHEALHRAFGFVDNYRESAKDLAGGSVFRTRAGSSRVDGARNNIMGGGANTPVYGLRKHHLDVIGNLLRPALERPVDGVGGPMPYTAPHRIADLTVSELGGLLDGLDIHGNGDAPRSAASILTTYLGKVFSGLTVPVDAAGWDPASALTAYYDHHVRGQSLTHVSEGSNPSRDHTPAQRETALTTIWNTWHNAGLLQPALDRLTTLGITTDPTGSTATAPTAPAPAPFRTDSDPWQDSPAPAPSPNDDTSDPDAMNVDWTDPDTIAYNDPDYYDLDTLDLASPTNDDLPLPSFLTDDPGPSTDHTHAMDTDDMSWLTPDDSMDWATLAHDITTDLNTGFDPGFGIDPTLTTTDTAWATFATGTGFNPTDTYLAPTTLTTHDTTTPEPTTNPTNDTLSDSSDNEAAAQTPRPDKGKNRATQPLYTAPPHPFTPQETAALTHNSFTLPPNTPTDLDTAWALYQHHHQGHTPHTLTNHNFHPPKQNPNTLRWTATPNPTYGDKRAWLEETFTTWENNPTTRAILTTHNTNPDHRTTTPDTPTHLTTTQAHQLLQTATHHNPTPAQVYDAWHTYTHTTNPGTRLTRALLTTWENNPHTQTILTTSSTETPSTLNPAKIRQLKNSTPLLKHVTEKPIQKIFNAYKNNTLKQLAEDQTFYPIVDPEGNGNKKRLTTTGEKTAFLDKVTADWRGNPTLRTLLPTPSTETPTAPSTETPTAPSTETPTALNPAQIKQLKNATPILKHVADRTIQKIFDAHKNGALPQLAKVKNFQPKADLEGNGNQKPLQSSAEKTTFLEKIAADWHATPELRPLLPTPSTEIPTALNPAQIKQLKNAAPILKKTSSRIVQRIFDAYQTKTFQRLSQSKNFYPNAILDSTEKSRQLRKYEDKKIFFDQVEASWNAQRSRDSAFNALFSSHTGESSTTYAGPSIYTALTHTGPTPTPGIDPTTPATAGRSPIQAAQREVAAANTAVVRYETTLENTRIDRGLFYTDLNYLGSMVVAAQLRLDAAHAQTRLAQAETHDAHNDTPLAQNRATTITEHAAAETRTAQNDLDTAHTAYQQEGGTYTPDNTPTTTLIP
ncbi:hypothetical protein, partial [Nocardiopsis ansamitocini]|uniref:hypothetical protein n=1 Tax=Nocardiopsis ansamitocini TaxID=1670832 RepID=UPI002552A4D1